MMNIITPYVSIANDDNMVEFSWNEDLTSTKIYFEREGL